VTSGTTARAGDATPRFTRVALLTTLALTAGMLGAVVFGPGELRSSYLVTVALWLFTALFIARVAGQVLVALAPRRWLPPMNQWNLMPYRLLLPIQLGFIVIMIWIDLQFTRGVGIALAGAPRFGAFLLAFSAIYASVMAIRYGVRMWRRPEQRWFGGSIPIVFHFVLASYLYVLSRVYVG
jgi:hypothetical protein